MTSKWTKWTADKEVTALAGVYALVTGEAVCKLKKNDPIGLLYIGGAGKGAGTLRSRLSQTKQDLFKHSVLWYVLSDSVSPEGGQLSAVVLPHSPTKKAQSTQEWPPYKAETKDGLGRPQLWYMPGVEDWENVERLLQIHHFFEFGQYPPFNAKCPSIMSIYKEWSKGKNWGQKWEKLKIKSRWDELLNEIEKQRARSKK